MCFYQNGHLVRLGEQRHQEVRMLQAQLKGLEERARSTILAQGAELSTAHVILSELLTLLKSEYPNSADVIEEVPSSVVKRSSGFGLADKIKSLGRSLISSRPEKDKSDEDDDLMSGCLLNDPTLQNLSEAIMKRQKSEEINNGFSELLSDSEEDGPSLESKLELLKICMQQLITDLKNRNNTILSNGNGTAEIKNDNKSEISDNGKLSNGHSNPAEISNLDPEIFDLNSTNLLDEDNDKKDELISRFLRHRKILMSNCEQAESEIKRVDEIYHDTINHVLEVIESLPQDTACHPELLKLKSYLEEENNETASQKKTKLKQNGDSNKTGLIQNSLEPVLAGKRQILHLTETAVPPTLNQSL